MGAAAVVDHCCCCSVPWDGDMNTVVVAVAELPRGRSLVSSVGQVAAARAGAVAVAGTRAGVPAGGAVTAGKAGRWWLCCVPWDGDGSPTGGAGDLARARGFLSASGLGAGSGAWAAVEAAGGGAGKAAPGGSTGGGWAPGGSGGGGGDGARASGGASTPRSAAATAALAAAEGGSRWIGWVHQR